MPPSVPLLLREQIRYGNPEGGGGVQSCLSVYMLSKMTLMHDRFCINSRDQSRTLLLLGFLKPAEFASKLLMNSRRASPVSVGQRF